MAQPKWKFVANLGDATPLDYGGLFVYIDETGVYEPEMERLERLDDSDDSAFEIHRVLLERCAEVDGCVIHDVDFARANPHKYEEWFSDSLGDVAESVGTTRAEIVRLLCSDVVDDRAEAYRMIYGYHGWANGDQYPLTLTEVEVMARYTQGELS